MPYFYQVSVEYSTKKGERTTADVTSRVEGDSVRAVFDKIKEEVGKLKDAIITKGRVDVDRTPDKDHATPDNSYWELGNPSFHPGSSPVWQLRTGGMAGVPVHIGRKPTRTRVGRGVSSATTTTTTTATENEVPNKPASWTRVFVYGSLKQGFGNHRLLSTAIEMKQAEYVGRDAVHGSFVMLDWGSFPALVERKDAEVDFVVGEVYEVSEETLHSLDCLEGHPHFYQRHKKRSVNSDLRVWVYLIPEQHSTLGESLSTKDEDNSDVQPRAVWRPTEEEAAFYEELWNSAGNRTASA